MANTRFSGPVKSDNGFEGNVTGSISGGNVAGEDLTVTNQAEFTGSTIFMSALPTSDPQVVGQLWNNLGVVTVSAG